MLSSLAQPPPLTASVSHRLRAIGLAAAPIDDRQHFRYADMASITSSATLASSAMAMGPPPPRLTKKLDISSLMSPPDPVQDSFHHHLLPRSAGHSSASRSADAAMASGQGPPPTRHPLPMSPPISPYSKAISHTTPSALAGHAVRDPVLYPADEGLPSSPPEQPLFALSEIEDHRRIVDGHVRARSLSLFGGVVPPRREDYELALFFRSQVMKHYTSDRRRWLRKERELLEADRRAGAQRYHAIMPAKPMAAARAHKPDRVSKPPPGSAPRTVRGGSGAGGQPKQRRVSATPEPSRRVVAPNREDKDFNALPDYCPPLSSLPSRPNSLKVDWKGQPIDLTHDPHVHLLHPDEVSLAGNLRLDCATYLTSKRRVFERRLQCLRTGKEFRKTDAQQACKIDVNKASKLWMAFDKVGWLDAAWVRRFL